MVNTLRANTPDLGVRVLSLGNALISHLVVSYSHTASQMEVVSERCLNCSSSKG
jgi:hypothetical protein